MVLQDIIEKLQSFWKQQGCAILHPFDMPVGAGTLTPFTALRCLLPKPWSACYVQGCRRPNDGRYGHNPNRLSHYYQLQIIIQPCPINAQELYIRSLEYLNIPIKKSDLRFLEDDWENPSIGASGLGWEIWLNGLEVTQCTFFQKMASIPCPIPALEFTYGLERIAMLMQNVQSVFDIQWNEHTTYGDLFRESEEDLSQYSFEHANTTALTHAFQQHMNEAQHLLDKNVIVSAYEQCLQASHTFNVLHSRGALSTSERESSIAQIRSLTRIIAQQYRKRHGYDQS